MLLLYIINIVIVWAAIGPPAFLFYFYFIYGTPVSVTSNVIAVQARSWILVPYGNGFAVQTSGLLLFLLAESRLGTRVPFIILAIIFLFARSRTGGRHTFPVRKKYAKANQGRAPEPPGGLHSRNGVIAG